MKKQTIVLLSLMIPFFSCKEIKKEVKEEVTETVKPEVKLYTFDGGTILANDLALFSQDTTYQGQTKKFANPFYVISHPDGNLMWDAGLPEALVGQPEPLTVPGGAFTISRRDSVVNQLKAIGMEIDDFKYIALSHWHFDHTGHANAFKNSTWLVQEVEFDSIMSETSQKTNADNYNAIKDLTKTKRINGDFDVFGDGSVVIKSMPGHTPGHQVLYLDLAENGPTILTGDLYHSYENRKHKRMPIFNFDVAQTLESMADFEVFATANNAKVYIQHEREDFNKMPKAPAYIK